MKLLLKLSTKAVPLLMLFSLSTVASFNPAAEAATTTFNDVPAAHWAKSGIDTAVNKGYVEGYPGGLFMPDASVTRAEFIKMIVTATGQPVEATEGKWYESYVGAAQQAGLYASGDFANSEQEWNRKITRQEMARIAARASGLETTEDDKWMYLAAKKGLISGLGAGKLGEKEHTTRAQSVAAVERVLTVKNGGKLKTDKYAISSAELAWHKTNIFTMMREILLSGDPKIDLNIEERWKEENYQISTRDKRFIERVEEVIVIDLSDKNDPNLKVIPPVSTLNWYNYSYSAGVPVTKSMNSYLIYFKTTFVHTEFQKDAHASFAIVGFDAKRIITSNGGLAAAGFVYQKNRGDVTALIFPKTGWKKLDNIVIDMRTPSTQWNGETKEFLSIPFVQ